MEENKEISETVGEETTVENDEVTEELSEKSEVEAETPAENNSEDDEIKIDFRKFGRDLLEIIESVIVMIFFLVMVFTYLLHPVNIVGHSMYPTLNKNDDPSDPNSSDKVFMTTVFGEIKYGDILVIDNSVNYLLDDNGQAYQPDTVRPLNECIIKRAIATEGQTLDIRDSKVFVDGVEISEPYIAEASSTTDLGGFTGQYPITIPEGYVFVMGDNRNHSTDSRAPQVGLVNKSQVYGKAIVRYYPLSEFDILIGSEKESAN